MKNYFKKGFTLIELLVVISIIGLLSSIVLVNVRSARVKASNAGTLLLAKQVINALELYRLDNGTYPVSPGISWLGTCTNVSTTCGNSFGLNRTDNNPTLLTGLKKYIDMTNVSIDTLPVLASTGYYRQGLVYTRQQVTSGSTKYSGILLWPMQNDTGSCPYVATPGPAQVGVIFGYYTDGINNLCSMFLPE